MSKSTWRAYATPIIRQVIADNKGLPEKELRRLISKAYPFGQRSMHPYKIWCDEVNRQLGTRKQKKNYRVLASNELQLNLF